MATQFSRHEPHRTSLALPQNSTSQALRESPKSVKRVLEERLQAVWADISTERLDRLIESMPHRVRALYEVKGWYTAY